MLQLSSNDVQACASTLRGAMPMATSRQALLLHQHCDVSRRGWPFISI